MTDSRNPVRIADESYSDIATLDDATKMKYAEELLRAIKDYPKDAYVVDEDHMKKGWGHSLMRVMRNGKEVFSYERNYPSFGKSTCLVFHQYDFVAHAWRSYLLFSKEYARASVISLDDGVSGNEPYPVHDGKEKPGAGFCPTGFKVFPIVDDYDGEDKDVDFWMDACHENLMKCNDILMYSGVFALEAGCVWGDDFSHKLRYIDLSKVRDGVLSCDERYGYFELMNDLTNVLFDDGLIVAPRLELLSIVGDDGDGNDGL